MNDKFYNEVRKNKTNEKLINEIEEYVDKIIEGEIPEISFGGYKKFRDSGSRQENEEIYFEKRKQLSALGLYLQWKANEKAINYFNELLWSISNEFTWALAAHINYDEDGFREDSSKIVDLFASETAETLSELIIIHQDKIHLMLFNHILNQIKIRVINPFLEKTWHWETSEHNWSAVCGGCIGMTALLLEEGERQEKIITRVEQALKYYLKGFGGDGATLEGIGYWSYGFGYYAYYKVMKNDLFNEDIDKIKAIANFPQAIQISENKYLPFSDVPPSMELPTGLITCLYNAYDINLPFIKEISSIDFDHCYRWAHLSRNLWWTSSEIFNKPLKNTQVYFKDAQWIINRKNNLFFAIKGGSNDEPHNHNDIGSFIIALNGEIILADLGAGPYTAGYFGKERYSYVHTRSYYHSVPLINNEEQITTSEKCKIEKINDGIFHYLIDLSKAYQEGVLSKFIREIEIKGAGKINLIDNIESNGRLNINEALISYLEPEIKVEGKVLYTISPEVSLVIYYNKENFDVEYEKKKILNHYNKDEVIYILFLRSKDEIYTFREELRFEIKENYR